jgi:hypothetical protein
MLLSTNVLLTQESYSSILGPIVISRHVPMITMDEIPAITPMTDAMKANRAAIEIVGRIGIYVDSMVSPHDNPAAMMELRAGRSSRNRPEGQDGDHADNCRPEQPFCVHLRSPVMVVSGYFRGVPTPVHHSIRTQTTAASWRKDSCLGSDVPST